MKSFRVERQSKNASTQVIVTLLVLLMTIVLVRLIPSDGKIKNLDNPKTSWESSVIQTP